MRQEFVAPRQTETLELVLGFLLPTREETRLLRAILWRGEPGRAAFDAWAHPPSDALAQLQADFGAKRRLIPLLEAAFAEPGAEAPPEIRTLLRATSFYEVRRTQAYREIAKEALGALTEQNISFLATRGVCFAETLYGGRSLRHCHDIDLVVPRAGIPAAAEVLTTQCSFSVAPQDDARESVCLIHASKMPLTLHVSAFRCKAFARTWEELSSASVALQAYGGEFRTLSPAMGLLQTILHGATVAQRRSLQWICDAYKVVAAGGVAWEEFALLPADGLEALIVHRVLQYLAIELQARLPANVLENLSVRCGAMSRAEKRCAQDILVTIIAATANRPALFSQAREVRRRASLWLSFLFPSAKSLLALHEIDRGSEAPAWWRRNLALRVRNLFSRKNDSDAVEPEVKA